METTVPLWKERESVTFEEAEYVGEQPDTALVYSASTAFEITSLIISDRSFCGAKF
jgi:hypothetical protein